MSRTLYRNWKGKSKRAGIRALITAAGMGKRFGILTKATNKSLLRVGGKPLLLHILDHLYRAGLGEVTVVTGHEHERLKRAIGRRARIVYNPFYKVSGILGSFWQARSSLSGRPFIFTTSDHFFHSSVLQGCLGRRADMVIVVQRKKSYTREDAKVIIKGLHIIEMGKHIPLGDAHGEFGGMVYFSAKASTLFFRELETYFLHRGVEGYMMEVLLAVSQKYGLPIHFTECAENLRVEVDSVHDLIAARRMAGRFKERKGDRKA